MLPGIAEKLRKRKEKNTKEKKIKEKTLKHDEENISRMLQDLNLKGIFKGICQRQQN